MSAESLSERSLAGEDVSPFEAAGQGSLMKLGELLGRGSQPAGLRSLLQFGFLNQIGEPSRLGLDPLRQRRPALDDGAEELAGRGLQHCSDIEEEEFAGGSRYANALETPGVGEKPALDRQMVVLEKLFPKHQPVVDVEMEQGTGGLVEPEEALQTGDAANLGGEHGHETEALDDRGEGLPLVGTDQKVEIGLPPNRSMEVLVALPMAVVDAAFLKGVEEGG